jgi:ketosteroid isomerase-like protein
MKKILSLIVLSLFFACNTAPEPEPVNLAAEEVAISEVFKTMYKSIDDRNIDLLASVFADDGVFMGTDPTELFPKDTIVALWAQMMQMPEIPPFEFISEPFIRIHPDGKTAVVSQQYHWDLFTPIPLRQTFWMVKRDSVWLIDFFDFSFIPYNEQISTLNAAVMKEKE